MKKLIFIILGIIYYFIIQINVVNIKQSSDRIFTFTVNSHIPQNIKLHIQAKRNELQLVQCNKSKVFFILEDRLWFERTSEEVSFHFTRGITHCKLITQKGTKKFSLIIKRKPTYLEYMVLFVFIGLPIISLLFSFLIQVLKKVKSKISFEKLDIDFPGHNSNQVSMFIVGILFMGMLIRIMYYYKFGMTHFQHDWHGHIEFIKYIANNWSLPLGAKGLQFPQQPLYYVIAAGIYKVGISFGMHDMKAMMLVGYFALFCSFIFLYYAYKFFTLVTQSKWVQTVALSFLAFTPSLVYMSARINNDVLVMALSSVALYYIVKSYQAKFNENFYKALVAVSLLFMTKISAAPMELLLFSLLIVMYVKEENNVKIRNKLFIFSVVGMFLLGFTLLKAYLPIEQTFHMVNSSGAFPGQIIKTLDFSYFFTYNLMSLLSVGYSHVFGEDVIRFSFLTYQYGTMFFGEFKYTSSMESLAGLKEIMQLIFLLGTVYIVGFFIYSIKLPSLSILNKVLFITLLLNLLLILKFVFSYPVVCNTDFRYFVTSFVLVAFIFAKGLEIISSNKWIRYSLNFLIGLIIVSESIFYILYFRLYNF